jgi:hypothetical protein
MSSPQAARGPKAVARFLRPRSVAIVGRSSRPGSAGQPGDAPRQRGTPPNIPLGSSPEDIQARRWPDYFVEPPARPFRLERRADGFLSVSTERLRASIKLITLLGEGAGAADFAGRPASLRLSISTSANS